MPNTLHPISVLANISSIIFAIFGFIMVIMNWREWKNTETVTIRVGG